MIIKLLLTSILGFSLLSLSAQIEPQSIGSLPSILPESSGLQCPHPDTCYTFNDGDNGSRIYKINGTGAFLGQTVLSDADQVDYEDIARASDRSVSIGDFGNNSSARQDLVIYVSNDLQGSISEVQSITYTYEDQMEFPPSSSERNFDVEAMFHYDEALYLFTRNRKNPFDGICKIYRLPDTPGEYVAELIQSFTTNLSESYGIITGADISPNGNRIALLTSGSLFIWTSWTNDFDTWVSSYNFFSTVRDYEGVSFVDDCTLLLTEESSMAQIYSINCCDIVSDVLDDNLPQFRLVRNVNSLNISSALTIESISIISVNGQTLTHAQGSEITVSSLSQGLYLVGINGSWGTVYKQLYIGD